MKYVNNIKDLEKEKNTEYLLLTDSSVHIPGDERSKQCPGHGYPAHDVKYMKIEVHDSEDSLEQSILKHEKSKTAFVILDAKLIKIDIKKSINIIR
jgi:hypothetical protein